MKLLKQMPKLNRKHPPKKVRTIPHGELNKTFLIAIIALVAVVGLFSLFFFTDTFAGKAIATGNNVVDVTYDRGRNIFTLTGDFEGTANELFFMLRSLTDGYSVCDDITDIIVTQDLGWELNTGTEVISAQEVFCENNAFIFGDAALLSEDYSANTLELQFQLNSPPNNFVLSLEHLDLINGNSGEDYFSDVSSGEFTFSAPPSTVVLTSDPGSGSSSSGGGGGTCNPKWECSEWETCNSTLQQSRKCIDISRCKRADKVEIQTCKPCQESWTCSLWSDCTNGAKTRTCVDEHSCKTLFNKPAETSSCTLGGQGTTARTMQGTQVQQVAGKNEGTTASKPAGIQQPAGTFSQVWEENKVYFIIIPVVLVSIIILLIVLFKMLHRPKKGQYNYDDLKGWVMSEKTSGATEKEIRRILKEKTDWNDQDMDLILREISVDDTTLAVPEAEKKVQEQVFSQESSLPRSDDPVQVDTSELDWDKFDSVAKKKTSK